MRDTRGMVGALALAVALTGCASLFGANRTACRWTSAAVGFAAGGLAGGLAVNAIDLSSTDQGGATIGGVLGGGALGALVGAVIGMQVCPDDTAEAPPPPDAPGEPGPAAERPPTEPAPAATAPAAP